MLRDNSSQLRTGYKETTCFQGKIVALKSIVCGDSQDTIFPISVDSEGRLLRGPFPLGRNTIESINHLANDAECDEKWQQIDGETKMK